MPTVREQNGSHGLANVKQQILDIPRALRETLEKGRPEYDRLVRQTRWGDGPLYVVGSGSSLPVGLTGAYAFEGLLGWPTIVRSAEDFGSYSIAGLRPRSVLLAISQAGKTPEMLEIARAAKSRGAVLLALTHNSESALAQAADGVFLVRGGEDGGPRTRAVVCQQAAMSYIALVAARALKRHQRQFDDLEEEFEKLPGRVEWALSQLSDAVRSFAAALKKFRKPYILGGGFYYPTALQSALLLRKLSGLRAQGIDGADFVHVLPGRPERDEAVVVISGSRSRVKKYTHLAVEKARSEGIRIFSITDANDREIVQRSTIAVLLPVLGEMVGSILALSLLDWIAYHLAGEETRDAQHPSMKREAGEASQENKPE